MAYLILVPLLLISLTRPVSLAMRRYKRAVVMKVSRKLQSELGLPAKKKRTGSPDMVYNALSDNEKFQRLNSLFDRLNAMPESPIRALNIKRFTGLASIPAIIGIVSLASDIFDLFKKVQH
jgi:hypothetical protein